MDHFEDLKPGKRENAFYVKTDSVDYEKVGVQSATNEKIYIYAWDEGKKKHIGRYIDRGQYTVLE